MQSHLLLTGATGLIGRYLLFEMLQRDLPLAVLARPRAHCSAQDRIELIVRELEQESGRLLPRPICLEGDITQHSLGLSADAVQWVRLHCSRMLHNAASVTFEGTDRSKDPWLSNFTGAKEALRLAERTGIRELHWVSTAYVCGDRDGVVSEDDLKCGQRFRNEYEHSKYSAELLIRKADFLDSLTVYRPGIVVGDSKTGYTNSYHNIYLFLQFTQILSQAAERDAEGRWHHPVRLSFDSEEALNLVPVDWVAAAIAHLVQDSACHGHTYHLTHPKPTTCGQLEAALARFFNYYGVEFVGPNGLSPESATELEQMFYTSLSAHGSYWLNHPRFDCRNTSQALSHLPCPAVDTALLLRLFEFAIRHRFGKRSRPKPSPQTAELSTA